MVLSGRKDLQTIAMPHTETLPRVVLYDPSAGVWHSFTSPCAIIETRRHDEVMDCLRRVERMVESRGLHAAGFVSYEAAPAFDRALCVREAEGFPLVWFGVFARVETISPPGWSPAFRRSTNDWQASVSQCEYASVVGRLREAIAAGETYQVNYTFRLKQPASGDPWRLFTDLVAGQPPPYAAYLETADFAVCSASPELFFELDGERIVSRPMKGTIARGRWYDEDLARAAELAASVKNRAENAMIVDMMRNDLGRIARRGSVRVSDLFRVERYATLWQMTSCVTAETAAGLAEIFAAMFPCASITGAPKASTMRIIARSETEPRRIYTGSIGHIAPGRRARFSVAIRTMLIDKLKSEAEYGVGGGIVWDSTPQGEYDECLLKAAILHAPRPDFSLLASLLWTPEDGYALLGEHLQRLRQSAEYFGFPRCEEAVAKKLASTVSTLPAAAHKVRLLVARDGELHCEAARLDDDPPCDPVWLELAAGPIDPSDVFLYHKTTHRAVYAAALAGAREGDDVLLYNPKGEITETARGNIVVRFGDDFVTPPVSCGLLPGTYRARLLAEGKIREQAVTLEMLAGCDELIFINSVRLWRRAQLVGLRDALPQRGT
jgi:para-aminobenzoate synthetase / 4-amino-4-deoxychorismate lyase